MKFIQKHTSTQTRLESIQFLGGMIMFASLMFMWGSAEGSTTLLGLIVRVIISILFLFLGTAIYAYAKETLIRLHARPKTRMQNIVLEPKQHTQPDGLIIGMKGE